MAKLAKRRLSGRPSTVEVPPTSAATLVPPSASTSAPWTAIASARMAATRRPGAGSKLTITSSRMASALVAASGAPDRDQRNIQPDRELVRPDEAVTEEVAAGDRGHDDEEEDGEDRRAQPF
jgi:hypothetical protein